MRPERIALPAILVDEEEHHEEVEILDSKIKRNTLFSLMKLKDLPEEGNELVKASDINKP